MIIYLYTINIQGIIFAVPVFRHCNINLFQMAFEKAKELIFTTFKEYLEQSLFHLQKEDNDASSNEQNLSVFRLMLNDFYEEHNLSENPTESIRKVNYYNL